MTDAVGAPLTTVALVVNALGLELIGFHSKVLPFLIVAISFSPKLSKDHEAGSIVSVWEREASPQPVNTSTPDPLKWADLVPAVALVIPVKSFVEIPVYEINSVPTFIVPDVGNPVVDARVIEVPDEVNVNKSPGCKVCAALFTVTVAEVLTVLKVQLVRAVPKGVIS